jgi:competence protein ComEC
LAAPLALVLPQAASALWDLAALPLQGFFSLAEGFNASDFWLSHRQPGWVVLSSLAGLFWLLAPPGLPLRHIAPLLFLPLVALSPQRLQPGRLEMTVLDVGQGLAVVVRTADALLLYDTGAGDPQGANMANAVILPFLARLRAAGVDALVISHGDRDHAAGLSTLLDSLAVEQVWLGQPAADLTVPNTPCVAGLQGEIGDLRWWQLHPSLTSPVRTLGTGPNLDAVAGPSSNDQSCVLMLDFQGFRMLLPGDIGKDVERQLVLRWGDALRADVLVAPHHGSKTSSGPAFLNRVAAGHVVFTTGYLNRFGHPHSVVAGRYLARGSVLHNTAYTGALTFVVEQGHQLEVRSWREERAYYWQ